MDPSEDSEIDFSQSSSEVLIASDTSTPSTFNSRLNALETTDRSEIMYKRYKKQKMRQKRLAEAIQKEECPFSPVLYTKDSKITPTRSKNVFNALYHRAQVDSEKKKKLEKTVAPECTFQPILVAKPKQSTHRPHSRIYKELYKKGLKHKKKIDELQKQSFDEECTFKPEINRDVETHGERVPLIERVPISFNEIREKKARAKKMQDEIIFEECTFKPQTNNKNKPIKARQSSYNHLYDDYRIRQAKLERLKSLQEEKELSELQNKPKINTLPQEVSELRSNEDLIERLSRPKETTVAYSTESFSFTPKINKYKTKVGHSKTELYKMGVKKEQLKKNISNNNNNNNNNNNSEDISECTFSPKIHEKSKKNVENELITSNSSASTTSAAVSATAIKKSPIKVPSDRKMVKSQSFKKPVNSSTKNGLKKSKHQSIQLPVAPVDESDTPPLP